jgi:gluconate 2-dehydrogenase gamma chain
MRDPDGEGPKPGVDRRRLLLGGALAGVAGAAAADQGRHDGELGGPPQTFSGTMPWRGGAADAPPMVDGGTGYTYFTGAEAAFIEAVVDRLIPKDANGPSATEAAVPIFIDRQLAGPYGHGDHYYMGGPWPKGVPEQGYQSRYTPAELYRHAIPAIESYVGGQFDGKAFKDLSPADQDKVLKALESGDAKLDGGVEAKMFFAQLLQNTKEGYLCDPIYGGNKDMAAWKMIGFPGAHYDYKEWSTRHNERVPYPTVSIKGRPGWSQA